MSSNDSAPPRKTLSLSARTETTPNKRSDAPSQRSGSRARHHKERLRAQDDSSEFQPRERREGGFQSNDRGPRRDGEFKPRERREGGFQSSDRGPRREGGFAPRDGAPRRDGEFKPRERREGGFPSSDRGPRREGGFAPRDGAPRRDGEFKPRERREGGFPSSDRGPRREGGFPPRDGAPRRDGEFKPRERREGGFQSSDRGPRREGGFAPRDGAPRRDGEFKPRERREGGFQSSDRGPRREGGFAPRDGEFRPRERREGGFQSNDRGPRREGGFAPRDGEFRPRERREGGFQSSDRGPRREGGFAPRDDSFQARDTAPARRFGESDRDTRQFHVFASCPQGLEAALEAELQALDFQNVRQGRAGCHFDTDWRGVMRANLYSRLATRVLIQLAQAPVQTEDDILALAADTPWEEWFGPEHRLRVDTSAIRSPMQSLQYCNLRVKDGICDRLRAREGARPDIDTVRPDARVHLFLSEDTATLYLDTSGESLFKRGWRYDKGEAPLRENLAAGLLALSDWDPSAALLDPFCGSGTILIEAAWIALGVPPGMNRPFGFERLRDYDPYALGQLRQEAQAAILPALDAPLVGVDLDPAVVAAARNNAERARLSPNAIRFEVGDARHFAPPAETGWIVTNPPYGERLQEHESTLWQEWATQLKHQFSGWNLNVISNDMSLPQALRLKASRRQPIFNGSLECRLFSFDLVTGSNRGE